ncbi:hypothetical protein BDZ89DRAFT_1056800 [Hymenopellis radicata]|nr:hypothetical protein BDZ89DRAFT_1056800 [Hymenopellis radicata]
MMDRQTVTNSRSNKTSFISGAYDVSCQWRGEDDICIEGSYIAGNTSIRVLSSQPSFAKTSFQLKWKYKLRPTAQVQVRDVERKR